MWLNASQSKSKMMYIFVLLFLKLFISIFFIRWQSSNLTIDAFSNERYVFEHLLWMVWGFYCLCWLDSYDRNHIMLLLSMWSELTPWWPEGVCRANLRLLKQDHVARWITILLISQAHFNAQDHIQSFTNTNKKLNWAS